MIWLYINFEHRFNIFMHDDVKLELLADNADDPAKQAFVELVSTPSYEVLPAVEERRFIKTHLPFSLLPPSVRRTGAKVSSKRGLTRPSVISINA